MRVPIDESGIPSERARGGALALAALLAQPRPSEEQPHHTLRA